MPSSRYFADIFDADGKAYVFDELNFGAECCGPFDSLNDALQAANDLNTDDGYPNGLTPREIQTRLKVGENAV